jgi:uncharacterized membrane protein required for colicin V production
MAYFFDGAVIMILIVTALTGYCKGFVRYVITMLGTVAGVLVAFLIANMSAENVYNKYFKTQLITSLENAAEQTDLSKLVSNELKNEGVDIDLSDEEINNVLSGAGTLAENTEKLLVSKGTDLDTAQQKGEELSEYIHSVMPQKLSEKLEGNKLGKSLSKAVKFTAEQIDEAVKALSEGGRTGAEYLEKNIFRPIALTFIRLCVFMTVYVLMEIVIRLILRLSGVFTRMAGLTAANRFAGMVLGLCKGGLYLVLIAFMVCTVINATENKLPKFNSAVFENTYLFSYFFDILYK